ncbi:MAG: VWA domain-containing protein [Ignavibacteriae bacterium]|nr:MAG: VWA domain-containing protein [Ignavibacteriota bacterium]
MRNEYSRWTEHSKTDEERLQGLIQLFSYLSLKTSGDVQEALEWLRDLARQHGIFDEDLSLEDLIEKLKELGLIEEIRGIPRLTSRGINKIRQDALLQIFSSLKNSVRGSHETPLTGTGVDRLSETKPWTFGDQPTNIDLTTTLSNALRRGDLDKFTLTEEDLEVYETELTTNCATVILLDISHSMVLYGEDRITPAKQVSLALAELIQTKFPKDFLALVAFGDTAQLVSIHELPFLSAGPYHTNTRAGLQMARSVLRRCGNVNKQVFMVTDGKPSAIFDDSGKLYKNPYGLDPRIVNKTLDEALQCRREMITISTFMVAQDSSLVDFVDELTRVNRGRAYYSSLHSLGDFVFVDYIRNRRKRYSSQ